MHRSGANRCSKCKHSAWQVVKLNRKSVKVRCMFCGRELASRSHAQIKLAKVTTTSHSDSRKSPKNDKFRFVSHRNMATS